MIKYFLSVTLVILIFLLIWKMFFDKESVNAKKKVKFSENVEELNENFSNAKKKGELNIKQKVIDSVAKTYKQVNPANFYTLNENTPNFVSDTMQLPTFFVHLPDATAASKPIPEEPFNEPERFTDMNTTNEMINQAFTYTTPWQIKEKQPPSGLEYQSDYWSYKNEIPMNGGNFGGIVGYENMGEAYSLFYDKNVNDIVEEQEKGLRLTDDLRSGMGVPQKEKYKYNMSMP